MHYANGREAKNGDHVITKSYSGNIVAGVVYDLNATAETCNATVAVLIPGGVQILTCQTVGTMYHVADALDAITPKITTTVIPPPPP